MSTWNFSVSSANSGNINVLALVVFNKLLYLNVVDELTWLQYTTKLDINFCASIHYMKEWSLNLCILLCFCCLCLCHLICWTRSASSKQSPWMASLMRLWCIMLLLVCVVVLLIWPYTFALCRENGKKTTGLKIKANGATGCCVQLVAARSCRWIAFPWQPLLLLLYPKKKKYLDDFQSWYACHHAIFIL